MRAQVENEFNNGTFIPPFSVTVDKFLKDFVEFYGSKRWGLSAYTGNVGLIDNYINPLIGSYNVEVGDKASIVISKVSDEKSTESSEFPKILCL